MARILITGGSGFIGTNLVEFYLGQNHQILNIDKEPPRNSKHQQFWKPCNILSLGSLKDAIQEFDPEYFFHLAARTDLNGVSLDEYADNTVGVENVIESIKDLTQLKAVIFASSRLVCEIGYVPKSFDDYKPSTIYGESKVIGEQIVKNSNLIPCPWDIVRPTSIWGPWFDIPYKNFFEAVLSNRYFHPKGRRILKSFGYVGNTVYELNKIIFRDDALRGQTFYLADYPALEVKEFADLISSISGRKKVFELPLFTLRILAYFGDSLKKCGYSNPPLTRFRLDNLLADMMYDTSNIQSVVGKLPFSLPDGVQKTLLWMKQTL